jgi:hypothetical protein
VNPGWSKVDDYYKKLDERPTYLISLLLYPTYRLHRFEEKRGDNLEKHFGPIEQPSRAVYNEEYALNLPE